MTRKEIISLIGVITMAYQKFDKFRDENHIRSMVTVWADIFSEDDASLVGLAVKEHINTSVWPPSIAEIRERMFRITNPNIIPPEEAWSMVAKLMYVEGEYNHRDYHKFLPKAIAETIDAIGYTQLYGLHVAYIRGSSSKAGLDRVAFIQAYEEKYEQQRRTAMLPKQLRQSIDEARALHDGGTKKQIAELDDLYTSRKSIYEHRDDLLELEAYGNPRLLLGESDNHDTEELL